MMSKNKFLIISIFLLLMVNLIAIYVFKAIKAEIPFVANENQPEDSYEWVGLKSPGLDGTKIDARSSSKIYYVDKSKGNDSNPGTTEILALKTIQEANEKVAAGDTVYVKNGIYDESITVKASGNPSQWIVFKAFPGHKPLVRGNQYWLGGFKLEGNYIEINGFELTAPQLGSGIHIGNGNHHIKILNNKAHDSGCGGISGQETDYLYIEGNVSYYNAFRSPYQCSGISIYQAKAFDDQPGFHNIIRGNISYSNENKLRRSDGKVTDGNGIIIDDFRHTQGDTRSPKYTPWTLVENNIVFDNGGRGIHIFLSDNVVVRNNTAFKNLKSSNLDGTLNGELTTYFSSNVLFYNNIAYARDKSRKTFMDDSSMNNKWDYNLSYNGNPFIANGLGSNTKTVSGSHNLIGIDPLFVNPSIIPNKANFYLQSKSHAINSGTLTSAASLDFKGNKRPLGSGYDIGAYEFNFSPNTTH